METVASLLVGGSLIIMPESGEMNGPITIWICRPVVVEWKKVITGKDVQLAGVAHLPPRPQSQLTGEVKEFSTNLACVLEVRRQFA